MEGSRIEVQDCQQSIDVDDAELGVIAIQVNVLQECLFSCHVQEMTDGVIATYTCAAFKIIRGFVAQGTQTVVPHSPRLHANQEHLQKKGYIAMIGDDGITIELSYVLRCGQRAYTVSQSKPTYGRVHLNQIKSLLNLKHSILGTVHLAWNLIQEL